MKPDKRPVTVSLLTKMMRMFAATFKEFIETRVSARLAALERRIDQLESRRELTYEGTWSADRAYLKNAAVTCGGSLWVAKFDQPSHRPGSDPDTWQLAVKHGRDGRDLRNGDR